MGILWISRRSRGRNLSPIPRLNGLGRSSGIRATITALGDPAERGLDTGGYPVRYVCRRHQYADDRRDYQQRRAPLDELRTALGLSAPVGIAAAISRATGMPRTSARHRRLPQVTLG
jgi:hypothetical protein